MGTSKIYPHPHPDALEEARRLVSEVNSYTFEKKRSSTPVTTSTTHVISPQAKASSTPQCVSTSRSERLRTRIEKIERVRDMLKELASKENA